MASQLLLRELLRQIFAGMDAPHACQHWLTSRMADFDLGTDGLHFGGEIGIESPPEELPLTGHMTRNGKGRQSIRPPDFRRHFPHGARGAGEVLILAEVTL